MKRLVFGVGINDASYTVKKSENLGVIDGKRRQKLIWFCPYYYRWKNMITRCYSEQYHNKHPTYADCVVCEEWLTFSNFKVWMEKQDWEGKHLDKDLLVPGNKVYSSETCVFVSEGLNHFVQESGAIRGSCAIGVSWSAKSNKYVARVTNPFLNKAEYLGLFDRESDAFEAWLNRKRELAEGLAREQTDARVATALISRYDNYFVPVDLSEFVPK